MLLFAINEIKYTWRTELVGWTKLFYMLEMGLFLDALSDANK